MASVLATHACSQADHSLVDRCFDGASKEVKEAALVAIQQLLHVSQVAHLDSRGTGAAGLLRYLMAYVWEGRELCKLLVEHNTELAGAELVYAAEYGKQERVRQLLAEGAFINAQDECGRTPLIAAVCTAVSGGLQCEEALAFIATLLDLGADPRVHEDESRGVLVRMADALTKYKYNHHTPLHVPNFRRLLQRLVAAGADINARGPGGLTVLGMACQAVSNPALGPPEPLLRALVDAGADLQAEQPVPLPHLVLSSSDGTNAPLTLRALAALGCPMGGQREHRTAMQFWVDALVRCNGRWPNQQPPSALQLSCLEALADSGCPLVSSSGSGEHNGSGAAIRPPGYWLARGITTGSLAVVQALLRACPAAASWNSLDGSTALERATTELWCDITLMPKEQLEQPLEGRLGARVLWYCTVARLLLAAGSPPLADHHAILSFASRSCKEQLRFLPIVASGSSWSPVRHHLYPPAFCAAVRQLLFIHECCGFGARQPSSGQVPGAGWKRRAGSGQSSKPARTKGVQLPQVILHHILELASQPLLDWVPQLAAMQ